MFFYDPSQSENQAPAPGQPGNEAMPGGAQPPVTPVTLGTPAITPPSLPDAYTQPDYSARPGGQYSQPGQYAQLNQPAQPSYIQPVHTPQPGLPSHYVQPAPTQPQQRGRKNTGPRSAAIFLLTCVVTLLFGVGLFSGWAYANAHPANTPSAASTSTPSSDSSSGNNSNATLADSQQEAVIAKLEPSVVEIQGVTSQGEAIGSGIIIDNKGDIVTNAHVIDGTSSLEVILNNGNVLQTQVIGTDPNADLAVIRIQPFANMAVATLGDSSKLSVGESVLAIGSPLGYSGTATEGVISALNRSVAESSSVTLSGLIQTSAAINPGNSGGALVNLQGQVIGMPALSAVDTETNTPANGLGFAIPSNQIKAVATQIVGQQ